MPFGLPLVGSILGGAGKITPPAFTDTGSAISGATLGPVTIGGLNPPPQGFELTPLSIGIGVALAAGLVVIARLA